MTAARLTTAEQLAAIADVQARRHVRGDDTAADDGPDPQMGSDNDGDSAADRDERFSERQFWRGWA